MTVDPTATTSGDLAHVLSATSVAVIGASDDETRIGGRVVARLKDHFTGDQFPISRSSSQVQGLDAFTSLADLDVVPQLAVIAVPSGAVHSVVQKCAALHVPAAIVLSSGFAETGMEGKLAQEQIRDTAAAAGMRLIGPNSLGVVNVRTGLAATFMPLPPELRQGKIAIVSQSGGVGSSIFKELQRNGLGVGLYFATGNEADVVASEVAEAAVEDPEIELVMVCIEGAQRPEGFVRAARRASVLGKAILMVKMGSSEAGARGAKGHTGAVSSDDDAFRAALRAAGVVFVKDPMALIDHAHSFVDKRRPAGPRVGIVTISGGMGVHLSDVASDRKLDIPVFSPEEQARFQEWLPGFAGATNPIDLTAQTVVDGEIFPNVLAQMSASTSIDSIVLYATETGKNREVFDAIEKGNRAVEKPFLVVVKNREEVYDLLSRDVAAVADPSRAIDVMSSMVKHARRDTTTVREPEPGATAEIPREALKPGLLDQKDTFRLLESFDVECAKFAVASTAEGAAEAASTIGFPVVLKLDADGLVHKSDLGGVVLALQDADSVAAAARRLGRLAEAEGLATTFLVQEMVKPGLELFCGLRRSGDLGAVLVLGLGGHLVEILAEAETLMAHESDREIEWALRQLCGGRLVSHHRGLTEAMLGQATYAIGRVATIGVSLPEVEEIDVNPLIVSEGRVLAVDAACHIAAR